MNHRALCLTCVLGVIGTPVAAVCPSPVPKACSLYFDSDAVFVATVLSHRYVDNDERVAARHAEIASRGWPVRAVPLRAAVSAGCKARRRRPQLRAGIGSHSEAHRVLAAGR